MEYLGEGNAEVVMLLCPGLQVGPRFAVIVVILSRVCIMTSKSNVLCDVPSQPPPW